MHGSAFAYAVALKTGRITIRRDRSGWRASNVVWRQIASWML